METRTLLSKIHEHCSRTGMKPTTFGRKSVNDGKLVPRLEAGGQCLPSTAAKVVAFIEAHPSPEGVSA